MRLLSCLAACAVAAAASLAQAEGAEGAALLTATVGGAERSFTLEELQAMPSESFETETIWTEGPQSFEGVPLAALLEELGVTGGTVTAQAINDYSVEIPVDEIGETAPIVAYHQNGAPMPRRGKGPLWLVYPYDADPAFQAEVIYSRSIWQMDRLTVTVE